MKEFFLKNYTVLNIGVEFLAAITGLILLKKFKPSAAKFFIYFLVYLAICDALSFYKLFVKPDKFLHFLIDTAFEKNYWWSTSFWDIGAILFFAFYYRKILNSATFRKIISFSAISYFLFSIIFIAFNWDDFFVRFFPAISVFGAVIIFLCTIFYFIEILTSDEILRFYRSLNFYISVAIFIWWLIITPIVFYDIYMENWDWNFIFLRWQIYLSANLMMYLTFTFALIWCKPEND